jgi:hypothetical protein
MAVSGQSSLLSRAFAAIVHLKNLTCNRQNNRHHYSQNLRQTPMQTYYYVLASKQFLLEEEPLDEVFKERTRNYQEQEKEIDFWLVQQPAFLEAPEMADVKAKCPQPAVAIVSTAPSFITWLKLRLEFVAVGEFQAPSTTIPDPLASLASVS